MMLVGMVQVYNEVENGNLERCLESLSRYCDAIQIYDDGSTDNPKPLYDNYQCDVIWSSENDFKNELAHKQQQLDRCKELGADWIFRIDADEVLEPMGEKGIRNLCEDDEHDSWAFHTINLWRSRNFYRIDSSFNDVIFNRLWRVPPMGLRFKVERGLHKCNYPLGVTQNEGLAPFEIIHYGFASDKAILDKYRMYREHGQTGMALNRLIDESTLIVRYSKHRWFQEPLVDTTLEKVCGTPIKQLV